MASVGSPLKSVQTLLHGKAHPKAQAYIRECLQSFASLSGSHSSAHTSRTLPQQGPLPQHIHSNSQIEHIQNPFVWHRACSLHVQACKIKSPCRAISCNTSLLAHQWQWERTVTNVGGARKVIEEQKKDEEKDLESKRSDTQFDRSLKARKAKNPEHQSVIAHMSDVRTPRSLLNKSKQYKWEVSCLS